MNAMEWNGRVQSRLIARDAMMMMLMLMMLI